MNAPAAPPDDPIAKIQARLERLALEPRVVLVPDGRAIVRELRDVLAVIGRLDARLAAIERGLASLVQLNEDRDCDSSN